MLLLGIETSNLEGSVALMRDDICLVERQLNQSGRRHAQSLVQEIGDLLRIEGLTAHDVDVVAVSRGPGSFTGLRVGMVCAKTFAYAAGSRFIAVDTFAAIAENAPQNATLLHVIEDAQRDDLFAGEYRRDELNRWSQVAPIRIVSTIEFIRERTDGDIVTGPGVSKLDPSLTTSRWLSEATAFQPRASVIAAIGRRRMISTIDELPAADTDFWKASPFYLRLSAAEEKRASLAK